jgi:predicted esterase
VTDRPPQLPAEARRIAALVHGTYFVVPPSTPAPGSAGPPLLVGFHGYGENAERHLAELRRIPGSAGWLLCAVQALHPFYNQKTGDVVASWMTRLDREHAIADNVRYAGEVVAEVRRDFGTGGTLVYAGFSQGAAMAYRAAAAGSSGLGTCSGLLALGGDVPPELADLDLADFPQVLIGRGIGDTWYTPDKLERDLALLAGKGVRARPVIYQGGHEWTEDLRRAAGDFLAEILAPAPGL